MRHPTRKDLRRWENLAKDPFFLELTHEERAELLERGHWDDAPGAEHFQRTDVEAWLLARGL